ncbi:GlxA family transcriptional regulator [Actinomycetospora termitidis]|uniref:GlxA family transcriptional regulator n=1 Tax=Actinomycetospora termitidis TaxID=3053470 RepID=A0ABT7MDT9_9PSEU|nr:GlxA family transcriptional regulator [Actinomycetospora sp. Odt1-22]MDL5158339.1 GlxA family transcriptional regulator [Actinomycetospora sp. Odt1-22]
MARTVALLAYDTTQSLDVSGPAEVFATANQEAGTELYRVVVLSPDGADVECSSGMTLGVRSSPDDLPGEIDTLVVPGSPDWERAMHDEALSAAVAAGARRSRRVAAVCGGAFLLGAVGLLDGKRTTTHWTCLDDLEQCFPEAKVERGPIFTQDGDLFTSAGVTAGIDLALALVEDDHGPQLARQVARFLVVFLQRPGNQDQFSARMRHEPPPHSALRGLLDSVVADPAGDHGLAALSVRAGYSERHLARVFMRELGVSPARYVEEIRLEAARTLLETGDAPLDVIARRSGLGSAETLRRRFRQEVGLSPGAYRRRFRTTGVSRQDA